MGQINEGVNEKLFMVNALLGVPFQQLRNQINTVIAESGVSWNLKDANGNHKVGFAKMMVLIDSRHAYMDGIIVGQFGLQIFNS